MGSLVNKLEGLLAKDVPCVSIVTRIQVVPIIDIRSNVFHCDTHTSNPENKHRSCLLIKYDKNEQNIRASGRVACLDRSTREMEDKRGGHTHTPKGR